jgi:hypothetical protein
MKKSELVTKIKSIVKNVKGSTSQGVDSPSSSQFELVNQFPEMVPVLVSLMTDQYEQFINEIYWVAPKPTIFKIMLINDQHFFLLFSEKSWTAQVEGKKYYLKQVRETQLAAESVSRILRYGKVNNKTAAPTKDEAPPETEAPEDEVTDEK